MLVEEAFHFFNIGHYQCGCVNDDSAVVFVKQLERQKLEFLGFLHSASPSQHPPSLDLWRHKNVQS